MKQKYFIAILPDVELAAEIISFRKKHLCGLNEKAEHKNFPHITLQHTFSRAEGIEEHLRPYLLTLGMKFHPFEIKLSGVGHFDHRVIYIGVEPNAELVNLYEELKNMLLSEMKFSPKEVAAVYHPHVTLEKKINKSNFNLYWERIKDEKFEGKFQCRSYSLMKHNGRIWEEIEKYELQD